MILTDIHISGFGVFNNTSLTGFAPGINIIQGRNEAGKSTLLAFIRYTLFGYPKSKEKRMAPLNGGDHGGRIVARLASGENAVFERRCGPNGGPVRLVTGGRETESNGEWMQVLGNATRELYENVYAFSLQELISLESLSASGVEDRIFSVGMGMGSLSLRDVSEQIENDVDRIYTRRGKTQVVPERLKQIRDCEQEIRRIQESIPRYNQLCADIRRLQTESERAEKELAALRREKTWLDSFLKCFDHCLEIRDLEQELKDLPPAREYPQNGIQQLDVLEARETELQKQLQELTHGTESEPGLEVLQERLRAQTADRQLATHATDVEYIRTNRTKYEQFTEDREEDDQRIRKLQQRIDSDIQKISASWSETRVLEFTDTLARTDRINEFKETMNKLTAEENRLGSVSGPDSLSPDTTAVILALVSAVSMIASLGACYHSLYVLSGCLFAVALLTLITRNYLKRNTAVAGPSAERETIVQEKAAQEKAYETFLSEEMGLEVVVSCDTALEVIRLVDSITSEIRQRDDLQRKQTQTREPFIREFEQRLNTLIKFVPDAETMDRHTAATLVIQRYEEENQAAAEADKLIEHITRREKELDHVRSAVRNNQEKISVLLKTVQSETRDAYRKKYAQNEQRLRLEARKKELVRTITAVSGRADWRKILQQVLEGGKHTFVEKTEQVQDQITQKSAHCKDIATELGERTNQKKNLAVESELSDAMTQLEALKEQLRQAAREWFCGKVALQMLETEKTIFEREKQPQVINRASEIFRRITDSRYSGIRLSLESSGGTIYAVDPAENSRTVDQLSRGTREQMLISLRLGFIEEYEKNAEPLPVVADEVLVNSDPHRAQNLAQILTEFAQNRQVLLFTCRPETMKYFDAANVTCLELK